MREEKERNNLHAFASGKLPAVAHAPGVQGRTIVAKGSIPGVTGVDHHHISWQSQNLVWILVTPLYVCILWIREVSPLSGIHVLVHAAYVYLPVNVQDRRVIVSRADLNGILDPHWFDQVCVILVDFSPSERVLVVCTPRRDGTIAMKTSRMQASRRHRGNGFLALHV
jgi:hypothetical protein